MQQLLSSLEDERQRQFRRFLAFSAGAHVLLALLFWVGPIRLGQKRLPVVETVQLVEAVAPAAAARPAPPKPAPAKPAPPPPPPPPAKKILPKQPSPPPKPKPEAKPKPERKPEPKPKEPEAVAEESYEELMERLREEEGTPPPTPAVQAAARPGPTGPVGGPGIVDPELARWIKEVKIRVTRAWIVAPGFRQEPLETLLEVEVAATGDIQGIRVTQSSGNPWYDENVERALQKASPLPPPPRADTYEFSFRPEELQ